MVDDINGGFDFVGVIFDIMNVDNDIIIMYSDFKVVFVGDSGLLRHHNSAAILGVNIA